MARSGDCGSCGASGTVQSGNADAPMKPMDFLPSMAPVGVGGLGVLICIVASSQFYDGSYGFLSINTEYSEVGWIMRGLGFLVGCFNCYVSMRGNKIVHLEQHSTFGYFLSFLSICWEVASVGIVIAVLLILLTALS